MRSVSIFGATGSIGQNTIDLIKRKRDDYKVVALSADKNVDQLARDAIDLNAEVAIIADESRYQDLKNALAGTTTKATAGAGALVQAAELDADWTMSAIVGAAGLAPGLGVLERGGSLALANKETLVAAGQLVRDTVSKYESTLIPVDSEHSAVFQALIGEDISTVERIIITASGGPFRDWPRSRLARATLQEALNHPNWSMGQRITIDSASMFNKALELIETKEFFGVRADQIETVVHPESLVHALVGFNDGALMAHLGAPDMRHAIGFALHYPNRETLPVARLDFSKISQLRFETPDPTRFPAIRLAYEVMEIGGLAGAVFNASKETALDGFIGGDIGFLQMAQVVETCLNHQNVAPNLNQPADSLDTVIEMDHLARITTREVIAQL